LTPQPVSSAELAKSAAGNVGTLGEEGFEFALERMMRQHRCEQSSSSITHKSEAAHAPRRTPGQTPQPVSSAELRDESLAAPKPRLPPLSAYICIRDGGHNLVGVQVTVLLGCEKGCAGREDRVGGAQREPTSLQTHTATY
jgi:hypothetical protein